VVRRKRLPILTAASALTLWVLAEYVVPHGDGVLVNRVYLAWGLPVVLYMAVRTFRRAPAEKLAFPVAQAG
jgi:hypothetical protein